MSAIVLTWNPAKWFWHGFDEVLEQVQRGKAVKDTWSVGRHKNTPARVDAYLYLQGERQGLVGVARTSSAPYEDIHFADPTRFVNYVRLAWVSLLPPSDRIPTDVLEDRVPGVKWRALYESGRPVPIRSEAALAETWAEYATSNDVTDPDEVPATFPEGGVRTVRVNRYERDARAREQCIDRWGARCVACRIDLVEIYGEIGRDYVHVHHVTPVSKLGAGYQLNPVKDLRPLCPNCHAMVHRSDPPLHPDALAKEIAARRSRS